MNETLYCAAKRIGAPVDSIADRIWRFAHRIYSRAETHYVEGRLIDFAKHHPIDAIYKQYSDNPGAGYHLVTWDLETKDANDTLEVCINELRREIDSKVSYGHYLVVPIREKIGEVPKKMFNSESKYIWAKHPEFNDFVTVNIKGLVRKKRIRKEQEKVESMLSSFAARWNRDECESHGAITLQGLFRGYQANHNFMWYHFVTDIPAAFAPASFEDAMDRLRDRIDKVSVYYDYLIGFHLPGEGNDFFERKIWEMSPRRKARREL